MSGDSKPWGGRFTEATDAFVESFTASVGFDRRLYHHDIQGSIAHANMLGQVGVLTEDERTRIVSGLQAIHKEIDDQQFDWRIDLEDVHMNIE
ncbi:MAG: lyase family protein, partial [Pseudomonadales bacterium]